VPNNDTPIKKPRIPSNSITNPPKPVEKSSVILYAIIYFCGVLLDFLLIPPYILFLGGPYVFEL